MCIDWVSKVHLDKIARCLSVWGQKKPSWDITAIFLSVWRQKKPQPKNKVKHIYFRHYRIKLPWCSLFVQNFIWLVCSSITIGYKTLILFIIAMIINDWNLIRGNLCWHKLYSMYLPVKRTWFFCLALVQDKKISHR
jgi:hypothetical protein